MKIRKAVITAAGRNQLAIPLQTLEDRDGVQRSALRISLNEAVSAGIEEICIVVAPGDREAYAKAAGDLSTRIEFVEQTEPRGYGHALHCAKDFVGNDPFLHFVSDHLFVSRIEENCAAQVIKVAEAERCAVSAVQATREHLLTLYGTIGGRREPANRRLYLVENVLEKPTPTEAEQTLIIPGLRAGHYLCYFGIHVLPSGIMDDLDDASISPALARLAKKERMLALEVEGRRYNLGVRYGLLNAQLALALSGTERAEVLALLVEQLATK